MLHTHSYNMGLMAGIAWKAAGKEHFHLQDCKDNTPESSFIEEVLKRSGDAFFFPTSFMEGFYNAFHKQDCHIIDPNPRAKGTA